MVKKFGNILKGASHGWDEPRTPVKYYVQNTVVIKRGKNNDFLKVHRRFKQVMSKWSILEIEVCLNL